MAKCWLGSHRPTSLETPVRFVGPKTDAASWIAGADIVVVPSREDPFPLVTLESMALGKPVVGARVGGIPDQLGDAGFLIEPESPAALASALERLCRDPELRHAVGAAAARRAAELFDATVMRTEILQLSNRHLTLASSHLS